MTLLKALLLALLWSTQGPALSAPTGGTTGTQEYLEFVCIVRQLDCADLAAPRIRFFTSDNPWAPMGTFRPDLDENAVLINSDDASSMPTGLLEAVVVHEVSHYVDWHLGLLTGGAEGHPLTELCASEAAAWDIYHAWIVYRGYDIPPRYGWRDSYPHCQP